MELINEAITQLGSSRKINKINRLNSIHSHTKSNNTKEEWLKAVEMQMNEGISNRKRREAENKEKKLKDLVDDFKKVRDSLYEEYNWKKHNLSDIWKKWDNTVKVARLPSDIVTKNISVSDPCTKAEYNCTFEIGATTTIFGALILLAFCVMKILKKLNISI